MLDAMTGLLSQIKDDIELNKYSAQLYRFTYSDSILAELARRKK
jgi:hypothetical protein